MARFILLLIFIIGLQGIGAAIGLTFAPGAWFDGLQKPFFQPPPQIFGLVWPVLYLLIAIAGWRVFVSEGKIPGWPFWLGQMVLNWAWSPIFFGLNQMLVALLVLLATLGFSIAFMKTVRPYDWFSALCFAPYVLWLSFASLLNASIWLMN